MHRLFTETFAFRQAHIEILEKNGFKREGTLRDHVFKGGVWSDSLIHGRLAREDFTHDFERVFVSGGSGRHWNGLVDLLLEEGAQVFVGDLKPCPTKWIGKVHYRQGDLNALTAQELLAFDPDCFFHLAATFERSEESYSFFEDNCVITCD